MDAPGAGAVTEDSTHRSQAAAPTHTGRESWATAGVAALRVALHSDSQAESGASG